MPPLSPVPGWASGEVWSERTASVRIGAEPATGLTGLGQLTGTDRESSCSGRWIRPNGVSRSVGPARGARAVRGLVAVVRLDVGGRRIQVRDRLEAAVGGEVGGAEGPV